jgi:acyl-ACP thioesterase
MKTYTKQKVDTHHCDAAGNLKASALLKFMQECSTIQLESSPMSQAKLVEDGKTYVLCRLNMSVYKSVSAGDEIEVSTWPCESRGLSFIRCYQARLDGSIIAEATTVWGIINIEARKFCRVSDFELGIETDEPLELDSPSRIHIPSDVSLALIGERPVVYSDLDINGHMNNTVYPDMLCDFIPVMSKKRILMLGINYSSEVKEGDVLKVYLGEGDGQYYIRTVKGDGNINCEAIIMTDNIY